MKNPVNNDNRYKLGSMVATHVNPAQKLRIIDYKERIYYCQIADDVNGKSFAYYERELVQPSV
jgi:hypothetical protein